MQAIRLLFILLGLALFSPRLLGANQTAVDLILSARTAQPGETVLAGLRMKMAKDWHTYWRNAGEAGKSTEIAWTLPEGITAGEIQWPVPEKYDWVGLINYVFHGEAILLIPLTIAADVPPGPLTLKGKVDWLECKEQCVPGHAEVSASLAIGPNSEPSEHAATIEAALGKLPKEFPGDFAAAWWESDSNNDDRPLIVAWSKQTDATRFDFFPYAADAYMIQPATETLEGREGRVRLRKVVEKYEGDWPKEQGGLLVEKTEDGQMRGAYAVKLPVAESEEQATGLAATGVSGTESTTGTTASATEAVPSPAPLSETSLLVILGLAFLGGLILNVMPCVLPVISLKILGFVNQSREEPGRVRRLGLIYALGVIASFLVLAGLVIGVQQTGQLASWGMQFGNPIFLVLITVLVVMVALNLFGLFEINLGGRTMGAAGALAAQEGPMGAFFNGILATALATPCTAPFLSVALGFAFTKPPSIIVLTFVVVALGLAFPYVLLSWRPGWLRFLPKPGVWMERFKVAMGFPMLATGIWLFSILARHYGQAGIFWIGMFIVAAALAAWIWGEFVQRGRRHKGLAMAVAAIILAAGYGVALEGQLQWRHPPELASTSGANENATWENQEEGIPWQPWSPEAVARAREQGRPVFVDFTADWCATCKWNKKTAIEIDSVEKKLKEINAVPLLADNTLLPENIARELRKFDRAGVPLVLVYPRDASQPPIVLPTLLTPGIVIEALERAAGQDGETAEKPTT